MNHFNQSLSPVEKWRSNQIVKQKIKLTISFTMTNGTGHRQSWAGEAIIIRRSDVEHVHDYARQNACPRDFLIVHIPMKIGLRNSEIRTLRIENIDFEERTFQVLDSKKYELFPLPLDMLSLELIKDLIGPRPNGYVFTHQGSWTRVKADEPLSRVEIWQIFQNLGREAGVKDFNPRMARHYFAVHWAVVEKKSVVTLQRILRHKSLAITQIYLGKLVFFEDIQSEFEGIQNSPLVPETAQASYKKMISHGDGSLKLKSPWVAGETICNGCANVEFCKFAPLPSCAESCKYKMKKEELKI